MNALATSGWLAHCSSAFRAFVLANLHIADVEAGQMMTHAGDKEGGICGLIAGQGAYTTTIGSAMSGLGFFGYPGTWWGQGPLLGLPRVGFATARSDCRIGVLPLPVLRQHLAACPAHWEAIAQGYSDLFVMAAGAHADLLIPDHHRRLAATLLRLGGHRHQRFPIAAPHAFLCNQEELAGALGVSRNTAGRLLRRLQADGLVTARYGQLLLADIPQLKRLADAE